MYGSRRERGQHRPHCAGGRLRRLGGARLHARRVQLPGRRRGARAAWLRGWAGDARVVAARDCGNRARRAGHRGLRAAPGGCGGPSTRTVPSGWTTWSRCPRPWTGPWRRCRRPASTCAGSARSRLPRAPRGRRSSVSARRSSRSSRNRRRCSSATAGPIVPRGCGDWRSLFADLAAGGGDAGRGCGPAARSRPARAPDSDAEPLGGAVRAAGADEHPRPRRGRPRLSWELWNGSTSSWGRRCWTATPCSKRR